jgi:site-specific DNA-adenine methylase
VIRAPFPWFGGKSRAAHLVWPRFGDVPNYVEPFAGSLAVLLGRPTPPRIETVNDLDVWLANFWRAVSADPETVAQCADWPVNEADLHARHRWLVAQTEFRERMTHDPDYFDAKIAGWWVWGICQWIGSGWCSAGTLPTSPTATELAHVGSKGKTRGAHTADQKVRHTFNAAEWEKRPVLAHSNRGVHLVAEQVPMLRGDSGAAGAGIHASGKRPSLTQKGGVRPGEAIMAWMLALQERLRRVRVCCGDWTRVLGRSATECIGVTAVFLDPPYGTAADRDPSIYAYDSLDVAAEVRAWALANGDNDKLRIALCGYQGEHEMPDTWECVAWKANGGYASSAGNHENAHKERIWFSPACLRPNERLF